MILLLDNYDSFTYNLYQYIGQINPDVKVIKNDRITADEALALAPSHIVLSPGPGRPENAGAMQDIIEKMRGICPILGICLGHQAICQVMGATITYAKAQLHGKATPIHIANGSPVFRGLPPVMSVGRYHSLAVQRNTLPDDLLVIAEDDAGEVMGVKDKNTETYGLQFHPESILTPEGFRILDNFLQIGGTNA